MKWSLRIARVSGIDIRVHVTFLLLVGLGAHALGSLHGPRGAVFGALAVLCLFACVVLHELGHSLVAQRFGVGVREIVLLPIGGVARLLSEPRTPVHELLIALAGPAVNVVIAAALVAVLGVHPLQVFGESFQAAVMARPSGRTLLLFLLNGNIVLALFNMIPALPMDGGRVFRAILSLAIGPARATSIAARVAQVLAVAAAAYVITTRGSELHLFLALLVFIGAGQERALARSNLMLRDLSAGEVCDPHAVTFTPADLLGSVIDQTLRSPQAHFLVLYGNEPLGTLSRDDVVAAAHRVGLEARVSELMRRKPLVVPAELELSEVRRQLQERGGGPALVRSAEGVLGVLGLEDLTRISALSERLARTGIRRPPRA